MIYSLSFFIIKVCVLNVKSFYLIYKFELNEKQVTVCIRPGSPPQVFSN